MRVIPVLDVMGGVVVRAVGGRRDEYRPVVSKLTDSTEPVAVAKALLAATGTEELYVADLDAIRGGEVSPAVVELTRAVTARTWLDIGVRADRDLDLVQQGEHVCAVVASETVWSPTAFAWAEAWAMALSIDLYEGAILGRWRKWGLESPWDVVGLARLAVGAGVPTLIVLDLAGVGTGDGPRTVEACRAIRKAFPNVELFTGGGIRNWDDVKRLEDAGVDAVLVASALHDGTLTFPRPVSATHPR